MMQRYLTLDNVPELRSEPAPSEKGTPEVEILVPVEVYWELKEIIEAIRYARASGETTARYWEKLARLVHRYIVNERDRLWFVKNVGC